MTTTALTGRPPTFDLLTEPWIPIESQGEVREWSLMDALQVAHQLGGVADPAPPIEFGLCRFLTAFVMDALQLEHAADLAEALDAGRFPPERLERYVESVGQSRFDLFDRDHPFLQTPGYVKQAEEQPVALLFFHLPTGTNVVHFHHADESAHAVAPAVAGRALTAVAPFMTQGGAGYSPSINGAPPWYVNIRGRSLFHTILLNAYANIHATESPLPLGVPAWRSDAVVRPKAERGCRGLLEGLTWQPRSITLVPGGSGVCTYSGRPAPVLIQRMRYTWGWKFSGTDWRDPNAAYRITDKGRWSVRPERGRSPWRDAAALALLEHVSMEKVRYERPLVANQLDRLLQDGFVEPEDAQVVFDLYGLDTHQAKVFEWRHDRLALPAPLIRSDRLARQVQTSHDVADRIAQTVRACIRQVHPDRKGTLGSLETTALQAFWSALESRFEELLGDLSRCADDWERAEQAVKDWKFAVRQVGWEVLQEATDAFDTNAEDLKRRALALEHFQRAAYRILHPEKAAKRRREKAARQHKGGDAS